MRIIIPIVLALGAAFPFSSGAQPGPYSPVIWKSPFPQVLKAGITFKGSDDNAECDTPTAGTIRYNDGAFESCSGSSWQVLGLDSDSQSLISSLMSDPTKINCTFSVSTDSSGLTITLDAFPSAPCFISLRGNTLNDGGVNEDAISSEEGIPLVIPPTATLGGLDGVEQTLYLYAADSSSQIVIAGSYLPENEVYDLIGITTGADSATEPYGENSDSGEAIKLIGRIKITSATAGDWENAIVNEVTPWPFFSVADVVAANRQLSNLGTTAINASLTFAASLEDTGITGTAGTLTNITISTPGVSTGPAGDLTLVSGASGDGGGQLSGASIVMSGADESDPSPGSITFGTGTAVGDGDAGNFRFEAGAAPGEGLSGGYEFFVGNSGDNHYGRYLFFDGHFSFSTILTSDPAIDSCGTDAAVEGSDVVGIITTGTTTGATCTVNFNQGWTVSPVCTVVQREGTPQAVTVGTNTSQLIITAAVSLGDGVEYGYHCFEY